MSVKHICGAGGVHKVLARLHSLEKSHPHPASLRPGRLLGPVARPLGAPLQQPPLLVAAVGVAVTWGLAFLAFPLRALSCRSIANEAVAVATCHGVALMRPLAVGAHERRVQAEAAKMRQVVQPARCRHALHLVIAFHRKSDAWRWRGGATSSTSSSLDAPASVSTSPCSSDPRQMQSLVRRCSEAHVRRLRASRSRVTWLAKEGLARTCASTVPASLSRLSTNALDPG